MQDKEQLAWAASDDLAIRFLRVAGVWLVVGVVLGTYMGISHDYTDKQIHVHGNLLGWVSCGVFAACYRMWPKLSAARLGVIHFWLHNAGVVLLVTGLALLARGNSLAGALLGSGSVALVVASTVFLIAVWRLPSAAVSRKASQ